MVKLMHQLRQLFATFLNRFTYRQRFIFFALVYIVSMPAPSFWTIQTQEVLLEAITLQKQGNLLQASLNSLLNHLLQHQVLSFPQVLLRDSQSLLQVQEKIHEDFNKLQAEVEKGFVVSPNPLAGGFSNYPEQYLPIGDLQKEWFFLLKEQNQMKPEERVAKHQKLTSDIKEILYQLGFSFGLFLSTDPTSSLLANYSLLLVPERSWLITQLASMHPIYGNNLNKQQHLQQTILLAELQRQIQMNQALLENFSKDRQSIEGVPYDQFLIFDQLRQKTKESLKEIHRLLSSEKGPVEEEVLLALDTYDSLAQKSSVILEEITQAKWIRLSSQKWFSIILLVVCTIFVSSLVMFRILTKHLQKVFDHIRDLSKGKFTRCFCSSSTDDFGEVGKAFDHLSEKMQEVIGELQMLGQLLSGFTNQINQTANEQESTILQQEEGLRKIEETAKEMIGKAKLLAQEMDGLSSAAKRTALADTAKTKLHKMQEKMTDLRQASTKIVDKLSFIQEKVDKTRFFIDFMIIVSDQTKLLSVNAAIETANIEQHKHTFSEITEHIERFSDLTAESTNSIKKIIQEMSAAVSTTRNEANRCLKEINEGGSHLITVSHQLTSIDKQRDDQVRKFQAVNISMQEQALAGETMLNSISKLGSSAEDNLKSLKNLHLTISEIGNTAKELQKVLDRFSLKPTV